MKSVLGISVAALIAGSTAAFAEGLNFSNMYAGLALGSATSSVESGGFNIEGGFKNENCETAGICSNKDSRTTGSLTFGLSEVARLSERNTVRVEFELTKYNDADFVTGSFPGGPNPEFFYDLAIENQKAAFLNAYVDFQATDQITLFGGLGFGTTQYEVSVDDGVVNGSKDVRNSAYNVGVGVSYAVNQRFELYSQARYVDFGKADVDIENFFGGDAGNYTLILKGTEFRTGLRINF
ncbi:outer membrane autotransporter barrel domain-containing protein [Thalassococcus halodurans]|uniref:Outer membrane autotransporter barrel domain-containing protein n=1 Tax=Thalassococcus halodurans TaxID=373675 RepID=A0A1H5U3V6_9RHOB|nr:outer membrane beta-barrel protein [Thalassococcus halodurans]SEF69726.1 outer membrane autotransporter barrel domain-containing protein [Thalassococcus halodurans]